jgi:hypothetical protein
MAGFLSIASLDSSIYNHKELNKRNIHSLDSRKCQHALKFYILRFAQAQKSLMLINNNKENEDKIFTDNLDPLFMTLVAVRHSKSVVTPNLAEGGQVSGTCGWREASIVVSRTAILLGVTSHVVPIMSISKHQNLS